METCSRLFLSGRFFFYFLAYLRLKSKRLAKDSENVQGLFSCINKRSETLSIDAIWGIWPDIPASRAKLFRARTLHAISNSFLDLFHQAVTLGSQSQRDDGLNFKWLDQK